MKTKAYRLPSERLLQVHKPEQFLLRGAGEGWSCGSPDVKDLPSSSIRDVCSAQ